MKRTLALALLPLSFVACSSSQGTGALLSLDYFGDTDVVGFAFQVEESSEVGCTLTGQGLDDQTFFVNLTDGIFPGMIDLVEDYFDPDTRHLGSDLFATMDPGCYDITATPLKKVPTSVAAYEASKSDYVTEDCSTSSTKGVDVVAGKTTEAELISQCVGDGPGALDTLVLINHPPTLSIDTFEKFNYECEITRMCATGYDINDDPVEFVWSKEGGTGTTKGDGKDYNITKVTGYPKIIDMEDGHRVWQDCRDIWVKYTDSHDFDVTIYDLDTDGKRIEDKLEDWGVPSDEAVSSFTMNVPWHVNWIEYPKCFDGDGKLVEADGVDIDLPATSVCKPTSDEEYYCDKNNKYKVDADVRKHLCEDSNSDGKLDKLIPAALYPECD